MTILILNGPNLNMLGVREKKHYGTITLASINTMLENVARKHDVKLLFFQSNYEGALIDCIQKHQTLINGILINPGALTHYGYSLRDALADTQLPIVEVHLSVITKREDFRKIDVLDGIVMKRIMGMKEKSYVFGLKALMTHIAKL